MAETLRLGVSEMLGTYALVLVGAGSVAVNATTNGSVGVLGVAFAFGLVVTTVVYVFGPLSGAHINPAVTIPMMLDGQLSPKLALVYVASQLVGATAGGLSLRVVFPGGSGSAYLGSTMLGSGVTVEVGLLLEFLMTFFLVLTVFAASREDNVPLALKGFMVGSVVTALILLGGPLTGASFNPARSFGPSVASFFFENHALYWVAPIAGGILAGAFYNKILYPRSESK